jgi:hypothetical protein
VDYLQVPFDIICLTGVQILTNSTNTESTNQALASADLDKINFRNREEFLYKSEMLFNFDQIMRATTIDLWQSHIEKAKPILKSLFVDKSRRQMKQPILSSVKTKPPQKTLLEGKPKGHWPLQLQRPFTRN